MSAESALAIGRSSDEARIKAQNPRLPSEVHSTKEGRRHGHLAGGADERSLGAHAPEEACRAGRDCDEADGGNGII